jgi:chaperonin GroEL (HSP60 family)
MNFVLLEQDQRLLKQTNLQQIFNFKFKSELDRTIFQTIVAYALKAEQISPFGFLRTIEQLSHNVQSMTQNTCDITSRQAKISDMVDIVTYVSKSDYVSELILRSVELAGHFGKVVVEKSQSDTNSIELVRGYTFNVVPSWNMKFIKLPNPRVVCIDGFVETVSEINALLESAAENKEYVLLFTRGISEEVKHTLKVNNDRGTLNVYSYTLETDLSGLNTIKDIATVSGGDVVSSFKGDLISTLSLSSTPIVEEATLYANKVVIKNAKTSKNVQSLVSELNERKKDKVDDVIELLNKRIKSLSPNHVVIRLIDDIDFVINSQKIDYALRSIKSTIEHGVTKVDDHVALSATELVATRCANECFTYLQDLRAVIR